jgi:hypothetical protein
MSVYFIIARGKDLLLSDGIYEKAEERGLVDHGSVE